ncbi:opacity protein-like surface antigen [Azospirillum agricola]|nr:opacity protein-like surface antigen [Azospirillum agricola]
MRSTLMLAALAIAYCHAAQAAEPAPGKIIAAGIGGAVIGGIFAVIYLLRRLVGRWLEARRNSP